MLSGEDTQLGEIPALGDGTFELLMQMPYVEARDQEISALFRVSPSIRLTLRIRRAGDFYYKEIGLIH